MTMEASPSTIIQYFNGEKQNLIPLFQRPYSWKRENWQTLWEDLLVQYDIEENSSHFMGAIVSVPVRSVPVGVSKYMIIDGQQRLTTLALLLCVLRDKVPQNDADRIQEVYLTNRYREPEDTLKLVPTQADRERYRAIVLDRIIPNDDSLMSDAYHFFADKLANGYDNDSNRIDTQKVLRTLEHSLQAVMINLGESDDPYLIFESLNFKGEPLTQADLVRNYLLMRFRHSIAAGGDQERIYNQYWKPMETQLKGNLTNFLRHYAMKSGDNIYVGGIYKATKDQFAKLVTPDEVEIEIVNMCDFASYYGRILNPELEHSLKIRKRLQNLIQLDVTTSYPLLLRFFDARRLDKLGDDEFERCIGLIEAFVVRRSVCGVPTNALNKLFLQWTRNFPSSEFESWLHKSLSGGDGGRRFPNDSEFTDAFMSQRQYGRGATRFILYRLEESFGHKETVDPTKWITIEHFLPQTLSEEWVQELNGDANAIHAALVDTFGNLTLTGYNSELGNMSFADKKAKLSNTHIELTRWILEQGHWGEAQIRERGLDLASRAKSMWKGPNADKIPAAGS
jgi:uncharacterized protein with ParB-like and HNH nuclease domain